MTQTTLATARHGFIRATLEEVMHALYEGSDGNGIVGVGMRRPTRHDPDEPVPHYYAPVLVRDLDAVLPQIVSSTKGETLYMQPNARSIYSIHRNGKVWSEYEQNGTITYDGKAIYYLAGNDHVASLNAVVIDLDVGKGQERDGELLTADRTMMILWNRVETGELPRPHFIAKSGRGVYIVYLLKADQEGPRRPVPNEAKARTIYERIQQELMRRLSDLYPDPVATSTANFYKLPETLDTKSGNRVEYFFFGSSHVTEHPHFTLTELAGAMSVDVALVAPPRTSLWFDIRPVGIVLDFGEGRAAVECKKRHEGPSRANSDWSNRKSSFTPVVSEIERLVAHREGRMNGTRTMTIFFYHQLVLWQMKELLPLTDDRHERASEIARAKAAVLNDSFSEPLKSKGFEKALRHNNQQQTERPKNLTLSALLGVTREEREGLQLQCLDDPVVMVEREERIIDMLRAGHRNRDVVKMLGVEQMQVSRMRKKLERMEGLLEMPRRGWRKEQIASS